MFTTCDGESHLLPRNSRTPYASNTFPVENYPWYCSDSGVFHQGAPLNPAGNASAHTYWSVYTDPSNPFSHTGFNGNCQFPQITRGGLYDSWQHGRDLWDVYHYLLSFLPSIDPLSVMEFRVTNNVITSHVASMLIAGMFSSENPPQTLPKGPLPIKVQPPSIDSLEPRYPCPASAALLSLYGPGSNASSWLAHLAASRPLFAALDSISGVPSDDAASNTDDEWHRSWDHYFDNLSARLCDAKRLPCDKKGKCVTDSQAAAVFRLGQHEYSRLWRAAPESLPAAAAGYGVWVAELAAPIRDIVAATAAAANRRGGEVKPRVRYRHNVAHDGSVARLLALLQVDVMVWPGMGAEVVFEVYTNRRKEVSGAAAAAVYVRVLWGGRVLRSSHPDLGALDMLDARVLLAYLDGLVGRGASKVPGMCGLQ
ncbi:putative histidine acid phosphatase [Diplodia seriata]|uniref:Putative histidine acid phosphatase n=1 Tax=Diplodia seriata TaxID=420778 RepID=A0A0G2F3W6_9PEZI|nr:putative histidine acid phosphatase [Diplodia seriata]